MGDCGRDADVEEMTPPEDKSTGKGTCICDVKCNLVTGELSTGATPHRDVCVGLMVQFLSRVIHCFTAVGREAGTK